MHMGNARTALLAWLLTRGMGGRLILRFEDLDTGRVRRWAFDTARRDLEWLGLDWDEEYIQSQRLDYYAKALAQLVTYPCTCTRREVREAVEAAGGAPHGAELVYPGTCRPQQGHSHSFQRGQPSYQSAALRWQVPDWRVCVRDGWQQETLCQHLPSDVGDMVVRRGDGVYAYHLAVVVDDAAMQVTDVVRGADLWPATPRQVALQRALRLPTPRYWHVPLMTNYAGERLAKRGGAPPVCDLREGGESPERVLSDLARSLGWQVPPAVTAAELLALWPQYAPPAAQSLSAKGLSAKGKA